MIIEGYILIPTLILFLLFFILQIVILILNQFEIWRKKQWFNKPFFYELSKWVYISGYVFLLTLFPMSVTLGMITQHLITLSAIAYALGLISLGLNVWLNVVVKITKHEFIKLIDDSNQKKDLVKLEKIKQKQRIKQREGGII